MFQFSKSCPNDKIPTVHVCCYVYRLKREQSKWILTPRYLNIIGWPDVSRVGQAMPRECSSQGLRWIPICQSSDWRHHRTDGKVSWRILDYSYLVHEWLTQKGYITGAHHYFCSKLHKISIGNIVFSSFKKIMSDTKMLYVNLLFTQLTFIKLPRSDLPHLEMTGI